jgi:dGTP triphosphohydrolase
LNKLCQFKHTKDIVTVEEDTEPSDDPENDDQILRESTEDSLNGNKCHLCMKQMKTKDDLYNHMERYHEDFYYGIMEVAKSMSHTS